MATYTIGEAMSRIPKLLEKASAEAKRYMAEYIEANAKNSTHTLSSSLFDEKRGDNARAVGSRLPYAKYVDGGRGPVHADAAKLAANPKHRLHWVYPRPGGKDYFALSVGPADPIGGKGFIAATKNHLESMHFSL